MNPPNNPAPRLRSIAIEVSNLVSSVEKKSRTLDRYMDFHNALNSWVLNTEHADAAAEVIVLLNQYLKVSEHSTSGVSG